MDCRERYSSTSPVRFSEPKFAVVRDNGDYDHNGRCLCGPVESEQELEGPELLKETGDYGYVLSDMHRGDTAVINCRYGRLPEIVSVLPYGLDDVREHALDEISGPIRGKKSGDPIDDLVLVNGGVYEWTDGKYTGETPDGIYGKIMDGIEDTTFYDKYGSWCIMDVGSYDGDTGAPTSAGI